jgi:hypothetical protein
MAAGNKVTLFFGDGRYGWSESYYDNVTGNDLNTTLTKAIILGRVRSRLLAQGANPCQSIRCTVPNLLYIRVSNVNNPRQTTFAKPDGVRITNNGNQVPWASSNSGSGWLSGFGDIVGTAPADNPYSAVDMLWEMSDNSVVKRAISGVPDWLICDQTTDNTTAWTSQFQAFAINLVKNWGSLTKKPIFNGGVPPGTAQQITNVTQNAAGQPIITVTPGWPLFVAGSPFPNPCNTHITVFGFVPLKPAPTINGVYRAFAQGAAVGGLYTQWLLRQSFKPVGPPGPLCLGFAMPTAMNVLTITDVVLGGPMKKDRGRPFDLPRGKSLKRH